MLSLSAVRLHEEHATGISSKEVMSLLVKISIEMKFRRISRCTCAENRFVKIKTCQFFLVNELVYQLQSSSDQL
jgi:hypothetical protein